MTASWPACKKSKFLNWLHVQYSEYYIEPSLKPFVEVIWSMEMIKLYSMPFLCAFCEIPVELVVHFADPYKTTIPITQPIFNNGA